jgi:hypothetical protein
MNKIKYFKSVSNNYGVFILVLPNNILHYPLFPFASLTMCGIVYTHNLSKLCINSQFVEPS